MKTFTTITLTLFCWALLALSVVGILALPASAADLATVKTNTGKLANDARRDAAATRSIIKAERTELQGRINTVGKAADTAEKRVKALEARFETMKKREAALRAELDTQRSEVKGIEGAVRTHAKEADVMLQNGPLAQSFPEAPGLLAKLLDDKRFPGLEGIRGLSDLFLGIMAASGEVATIQTEFIGTDGRAGTGDVTHVGALTAMYRTPEGETGYLRPGTDGALAAVPGTPWDVAGDIDAFMRGESDHVPVDISGGAAFQRMARSKGISEWLASGGLLVWPILLVGAIALVLGLERIIALSRVRSNSDKAFAEIITMADKGEWDACHTYCEEQDRFATCRVLHRALDNLGRSREVLERSLEEGLLHELPRLERFLPTLSILAAIAPLLGLLGTVTGMIDTFQVITLHGTGDPRMMSGGISEALITTQLGLAVAIPIMAVHHFLERRVDKILGDMEEKCTAFTVAMLKNGAVREGAILHAA